MINNQQQNINPDRSMAALAFITKISEGLMPKVQPEATDPSQTSKTAPGQEETQDSGDMESKIKKAVDEQLSGIREEVQKAMSDEPEKEVKEKTQKEPEENKDIENLTKDFNEFKGKIEGTIESKFDDLTKALKDALK